MMEHMQKENFNRASFDAKLHGMKMNAPLEQHDWTEEEDKRLTDFAYREYEKMQAEAKARAAKFTGAT